MEKLLSTLLENEILNEETKAQLEEAVKTMLEEATATARSEIEIEVRADLTKQFLDDKAALVEALDTKAEEFMRKEVTELKEDIERFRDLEVEYSERLVEQNEKTAKIIKSDMLELVEGLDVFIEMRLIDEMAEFSDSIEEVKKINYGKEIFEQFEQTYLKNFADKDTSVAKLDETVTRLNETKIKLDEAESKLNLVKRASKMEEVLSDLDGRPREIMEAVLKAVPTNKLEEGYNNFITKVLHETVEQVVENTDAEKEVEVLAENDTSTEEKEATVQVTGDSLIDENVEVDETVNLVLEAEKREYRKLAGIE